MLNSIVLSMSTRLKKLGELNGHKITARAAAPHTGRLEIFIDGQPCIDMVEQCGTEKFYVVVYSDKDLLKVRGGYNVEVESMSPSNPVRLI